MNTISSELRVWRGVDESCNHRGAFSQKAAAAFLGVPHKTYIDWEQGRFAPRGLARETVLKRITKKPTPKKPSAKPLSSTKKRRPARRGRE